MVSYYSYVDDPESQDEHHIRRQKTGGAFHASMDDFRSAIGNFGLPFLTWIVKDFGVRFKGVLSVHEIVVPIEPSKEVLKPAREDDPGGGSD